MIAVLRCDNLYFTDFMNPPLTITDIGKDEMGVKAADALLEELRRQNKPNIRK